MFTRCLFATAVMLCACHTHAQSIMGDVFSGKLINPEVGVFAWYDLTDSATGKQFYLRLAVVAEEKVKGKTGHWFEVELLPRVGFPAVYKMLLTGPASDPKNVHRIVMQEGTNEPIELETSALSSPTPQSNATRTVVGQDDVLTQTGTVFAEHVVVEENGIRTELWLNDEVRPMGLVRVTNSQGELLLRNYGQGGEHAQTAIGRQTAPQHPDAAPENMAPTITVETVDVTQEPLDESEYQELELKPVLQEDEESRVDATEEPEADPVKPNVIMTPQNASSADEVIEQTPQETSKTKDRSAPQRSGRRVNRLSR